MQRPNEEMDVYYIPPNFLTSGRLFGGMIRVRNWYPYPSVTVFSDDTNRHSLPDHASFGSVWCCWH